jgi:gliding motility-associated-like protein
MMRLILFLCVLIFSCAVKAQSVYNNGALLTIKPNTIVSIGDSLVNNGEITNNGSILISGTWINNNTYDAGEGQIAFDSDAPQVINHNDQSFSKLTISGGGEKIFQANITIENELNLADGVLLSANDAKIIFTPGAKITGGSDDSHIIGTVYQQGSGDKLFPVGNGTLYLPVEILNIEGAAEVAVHVVELKQPLLLKSAGLSSVSSERYWEVDVISGSLTNAQVTLPVRDEAIVSSTDNVVVAQAAALSLPFESLGQTSFSGSATNGKVTSSLAVTSSLLAIGTSTMDELPNDKSILVYNAVSPNGDGLNEFLRISNIEKYANNNVSIFNRWGDKVFEVDGYDNDQRSFRGKSNIRDDKELPSATYFYVIDKNDGSEKVTGFLSLKFTY